MKTELIILNINEVDITKVRKFEKQGYKCRFDNNSGIFYAERGGIKYGKKKDEDIETEHEFEIS